MAQIIITTIDGKNGSINSTFRLKDKDIERIYNIFKQKLATERLNIKINSGDILEASDSVENYITQINPQEILDDLASDFVGALIERTYNIERNKLVKEAIERIGPIVIEEEF